MKYRSAGYWLAGAIFWGLTSVALAEGTGTPPAEPVVRHVPSSHHDVSRPADRPQQHSHRAPAKQPVSAKPPSTQPAQKDSATRGQYRFEYANPRLPASTLPDIGAPRYLGETTEISVLAQNPTRNASPATSASQSSAAEPDDSWRFKASPLLNATHSHEIGATVSFRHDFW